MNKVPRTLNIGKSFIDKVFRRGRLLARPLRIHLEVNDICNLRCRMCARQSDAFPKNRGEMSMKVVERLQPWFRYASYVGLAGNGEPFLHSQIVNILRLINSAGAIPSVVTNATLLNDSLIDALLDLKMLILVVSIDGASQESFEFIRQGASFHSVIENLELLNRRKQQLGKTFPVVNFIVCVMRQNLGELSKLVELAHRMGASLVILQNLLPYNDWARESIVRDKKLLDQAVLTAQQIGAKLNVKVEYVPLGVPLVQRSPEVPDFRSGYYCDFLWQQLHVEVDGTVRFCCFWTQGSNGNLLSTSPDDLWNSDRFIE
ncbi:MAG: radical SAM protein, partial [Candidatus Sumerlaeia bacterium]|nr:radical SAM protein [Candidatus Sumerlaeia bacterium]